MLKRRRNQLAAIEGIPKMAGIWLRTERGGKRRTVQIPCTTVGMPSEGHVTIQVEHRGLPQIITVRAVNLRLEGMPT